MSASETAFVFAIVSEAVSDQQMASGLAERVFVEKIDWLENEGLTNLCRWRGFEAGTAYLSWPAIEPAAKRKNIAIHGRYAGAFDERRARLALLLFNSLKKRPDGVVFVRDTDNVPERVPSLEQARNHPWPFPVALATPHTKRECWILNGFKPHDADEKAALERTRQGLGFDPSLAAERLTAKGKKGKNNAKIVLGQDLGIEPGSSREDACLRETDLATLRKRGHKTLLAAYLQEVADLLVPVLAGTYRKT